MSDGLGAYEVVVDALRAWCRRAEIPRPGRRDRTKQRWARVAERRGVTSPCTPMAHQDAQAPAARTTNWSELAFSLAGRTRG